MRKFCLSSRLSTLFDIATTVSGVRASDVAINLREDHFGSAGWWVRDERALTESESVLRDQPAICYTST